MPQIPVNLGDVQTFESLPVGEYLGEIDKVEFREAREEGKFPQLMCTYAVIDGDHLGRKQSEWISLSPKAAFRLKKWFDKFGLSDIDNLDVDDETNELKDPDLVGTKVIFKVYADKPAPGKTEPQIRTELVTVEDEDVPEPAATTRAPRTPKAAATAQRRSLR